LKFYLESLSDTWGLNSQQRWLWIGNILLRVLARFQADNELRGGAARDLGDGVEDGGPHDDVREEEDEVKNEESEEEDEVDNYEWEDAMDELDENVGDGEDSAHDDVNDKEDTG
jgi:hypothetical protein